MNRIVWGCLWMALALPALGQSSNEKLGPGDTVHVTVFQQPDLTTDARVTEQGTIAMPLVGQVKIDGLTTSEAAGKIGESLKQGNYLKNPQVAMAITTVRSRQVSVLGLIVRPGRYPLEESSPRVPDLIAAAGGIAAGGSENVTVIRDGKSQVVNSLSKDFMLKGGDTVYVERSPVFYIYGEVAHGGAYPVGQNLTVMQALSISGGITPRGSENRIKLRRTHDDGKVVETDARLTETVRPNDVIYVKESIF
jgi:polysaccharide export outer membrane protein